MLFQSAQGFGAVALAALLGQEGQAAAPGHDPRSGGEAAPADAKVVRVPRGPARAENVIFLYMDGGPSQVDTFDPKPLLDRYNGRDPREIFKVEPTQFDSVGKILASPWKFRRHGECGLPVSELFPHVARFADDLAVVRSFTSRFSEHTFANYFLHTGHGQQGRPSHGAWINYGLGSVCRDLPGFVILNGGLIPPGGLDCFGAGFLPAAYQGSVFRAGEEPIANVTPREPTRERQSAKLALLDKLDRGTLARVGKVDEWESAIANYELAARMQVAAPELMNLSGETAESLEMYGLNDSFENTRTYGRLCLIARRLVERGVRFIELTCTPNQDDRWDQHSNLKGGHERNAQAVDRPIAALLADLKRRGLLDSTLVVWCGEFGRTPFAQGADGRDHNPYGFTVWFAGGGVRGGTTHGATDEFGYFAVENKLEIWDMHATILHLLGVDHRRITYRFGGRDMRLTDVHGSVIHEIL